MKLRLPIGVGVSPYKNKGVRRLEIHKKSGGFYLTQLDGASPESKGTMYFEDLKSALKEAARVWGVKDDQWETL